MDAFQVKWPRWRQLTSTAAHRGVLCFGPNKGRNVTYTNPHRWLAGFRPADRIRGRPTCSSTATCTRSDRPRPSTSRDGSASRHAPRGRRSRRWATRSRRSRWTASAPGWWRATRRSHRDRAEGVRLLPYFDAYVVAGQPRARLFPGPAATRALTPSGQAGNYPVLLVDGVVGGVWHQRRSGRRVVITVEPLGDLTAGTTARARGGGGARRRGPRRRAGADDRNGDGRRARLRRAVCELGRIDRSGDEGLDACSGEVRVDLDELRAAGRDVQRAVGPAWRCSTAAATRRRGRPGSDRARGGPGRRACPTRTRRRCATHARSGHARPREVAVRLGQPTAQGIVGRRLEGDAHRDLTTWCVAASARVGSPSPVDRPVIDHRRRTPGSTNGHGGSGLELASTNAVSIDRVVARSPVRECRPARAHSSLLQAVARARRRPSPR